MKILILTQTFPLNPQDSTAHFLYDFAQGFKNLGHEVTILLPFHPDLEPTSFPDIRLIPFRYIFAGKLHLIGFGRSLKNDQKLKFSNYLLFPLYFLAASIQLLKLLNREKFSLINAHWILPNGLIATLISKISNTPLYISLPGSDVYLSNLNPLFKLLARLTLKQAKAVISCSPRLLKDLGIKKGYFIPYGAPLNPGKRKRNQQPVVISAGRIVEKKGFEIIRKIYPQVEIVSGLPINSFRQKLLQSDILITLSIRDSRGNLDDPSVVAVEGMAAGCALIASSLPGYRQIITDQQDGLLLSPKRPASILTAINLLKSRPDLRFKLGQNARQKVRQSLTPEKIALKYLSVFQKNGFQTN